MRKRYDWNAIRDYYDQGNSMYACVRRFGFTITSWYKAHRRGVIKIRPFETRRYDWAAIQYFYDEGHSYRECRARFGFCADTWTDAVKRGALKARARVWPIQVLLSKGKSRRNIKLRLLEEGILKNICSECGISEWRGKPLSIQIDHINGVRNDHRLENLRMLCPNCHSQTETHGGRNVRRRRLALQEVEAVL